MPLSLFQVDAFTDTPFAGNPAAVCLLDAPRPRAWMQEVAQEMNLSETAFVVPQPEAGAYDLRWFTPADEVDLCGHATLASAHVLWTEGRLAPGTPAAFDTRSGRLTTRQDGDWIAMDFPAEPAAETPPPAALVEGLGVDPVYVGRNRMDYIVELSGEAAVRGVAPDLGRLRTLAARGVIVTARAEAGPYDFVSRFFAPRLGIAEDPVTGSAHCCLGPHWALRLGRAELVGYQASARGGVVRVRCADARVHLSGQAVTVLRMTLLAA